MAASILPLNPKPHRAFDKLTRVRIETRWRTTCVAHSDHSKSKNARKEKTKKDLDHSRPAHRKRASGNRHSLLPEPSFKSALIAPAPARKAAYSSEMRSRRPTRLQWPKLDRRQMTLSKPLGTPAEHLPGANSV